MNLLRLLRPPVELCHELLLPLLVSDLLREGGIGGQGRPLGLAAVEVVEPVRERVLGL